MTTKALTAENNSRRNLEAIESHLCCDDDDRASQPLTEKQQQLLERWSYADDLLRKDRFKHTEIVDQLMIKFGIGESSSWDDIRHAQIVFASAKPLHKRSTSYAQIRRIESNIRVCVAAGNWKAVTEFEKVLQKAIQALPDMIAPKSARTIIYNIQNNNNILTATDIEVQQAIADAESYLESTPVTEE